MENKSCFNWIVCNNYADADFWLINKGSEQKLGNPVKEFEPFLTGIKCPALINSDYAYYLCVYLHQQGTWEKLAIGSTGLKSLRIGDIRKVFSAIGNQHREQRQARYKAFTPSNSKQTVSSGI